MNSKSFFRNNLIIFTIIGLLLVLFLYFFYVRQNIKVINPEEYQFNQVIIDISPTEHYQGEIDPALSNDFINTVNDSILNRQIFNLNPEMVETIRFNNAKYSYEIVLGLDNDIYIDRKVRDTDEIVDLIRYQLKANQKENILEKINELIQVIE